MTCKFQTLAYGNNLTVDIGNSTLDLDRAGFLSTVGNTVQFGNLAIGAQTLTVGPGRPTYRDIALRTGVTAAQPFTGVDPAGMKARVGAVDLDAPLPDIVCRWCDAAQLRTRVHVSGLTQPIAIVQDPADPAIQFVVEQRGRIRVVRDGVVQPGLRCERDPAAAADAAVALLRGRPGRTFAIRTTRRDKRFPLRSIELLELSRIEASAEAMRPADVLIVPGFEISPALDLDTALADLKPEVAAIRGQAAAGTAVVSICVGAFLLAEAGLLAGRAATTSWLYADRFARRYADVAVRSEQLVVTDRGVTTTAAFSAMYDFALRFVREHDGPRVARSTARIALLDDARATQSAYVDVGLLPAVGRSFSLGVKRWLDQNLGERYDLAALAKGAVNRAVGLKSALRLARRHHPDHLHVR